MVSLKNYSNCSFTDGFSASRGVITRNFLSVLPTLGLLHEIFLVHRQVFPFPPLAGLGVHSSRLLVLLKDQGDSFLSRGNLLRNIFLSELQIMAKEVDAPVVFLGEMLSSWWLSMRMDSGSRAWIGLNPNEPRDRNKFHSSATVTCLKKKKFENAG